MELTGPIAFTNAVNHHLATDDRNGIVVLKQLNWGYNPWHHKKVDPEEHPAVKLVHLYGGSWHKNLLLYFYMPTRAEKMEDETFRKYLLGLFTHAKVVGIVLCLDSPQFEPSPELQRWLDAHKRVQVVAAEGEGTPSKLLSGLDAIPEDACVFMTSDEMMHTAESVKSLLGAYERSPGKLSAHLITHMPDLSRPELKGGMVLPASKLKAVSSYPIPKDCSLCPESWMAWCFEQMELPALQVENNWSSWQKLAAPEDLYPGWYEERRRVYGEERATECMEKLQRQAAFWRG